jgi:hypothetical protein
MRNSQVKDEPKTSSKYQSTKFSACSMLKFQSKAPLQLALIVPTDKNVHFTTKYRHHIAVNIDMSSKITSRCLLPAAFFGDSANKNRSKTNRDRGS